MKIVHIITRMILGGAQENTLITCRGLVRRGHDVTLITGPSLGPEGDLLDLSDQQDFKVIMVDELVRPISPMRDAAAYLKIRRLLADIRPDVVHTHSAKAGIIGRFAASAMAEGGKPLIVHSVHGLSFHDYQSRLLNWFYIALEKAAAAKTDYFITVADAMTEKSLAAGIGSPEQYTTVYSAIDQPGFYERLPKSETESFRQKYDISPRSVVLITVARLFELKGHDYIISSAVELAERFPEAVWIFAGDGSLSGEYKQRVRDLGIHNKVRFTSLLPPEQIPLAIQSSDILVHCSLREGLARAIPQAMLCGKPVVAFDLDGSGEVVNSETGRLVEPGNIAELCRACSELIKDKQLRETLGASAERHLADKFRPEVMVDNIERIYSLEGRAGKYEKF